MIMRTAQLGILLICACLDLPAPLIPGPNLAKRTESANTIVVAKLTSGTMVVAGSRVSNDFVLRVDRVLKGDAIAGSSIVAHLEGHGYFATPNGQQSEAERIYGIWFLVSATNTYAVLSRDGNFGELHFAPVILPEEAPPGEKADTPAAAVANEIVAALDWIVAKHGADIGPPSGRNGRPIQGAGVARSEFRRLTDDLRTLGSSTTLPAYRRLAKEGAAPLRAVGISGLVAANEPEGVKLAAANWGELAASTDVSPLIANLMAFSNSTDPDAVRALADLAQRSGAEPALRENTAYALRAIHTKEALPAFVALLDQQNDRIRSYALSGLCLFVRNAPTITPESVPSMLWLQSRKPTPLLDEETQRYCLLGGINNDSVKLDSYASFWKSWWQGHRTELDEN